MNEINLIEWLFRVWDFCFSLRNVVVLVHPAIYTWWRFELTCSSRSVTKESNVSSRRRRLNLTAAIIGFFMASRCALRFSATRSSKSLSLMSCLFSPGPTWKVFHWKGKEVNFSALVTDEAHYVACFPFFRASSESKFAVLIKSFPLFTQVRSGSVHRRRVSVSFCHIFELSFVRRHSKSNCFDTMLHINTRPPCWIYNNTRFIICCAKKWLAVYIKVSVACSFSFNVADFYSDSNSFLLILSDIN